MAGTNYGGGGLQEGYGIRWFGGMGERWKIDGRRREVAGRACPAPTGWRKGERVPAGRCAGVGWFRAIFVGGAASSTCRGGVKTPPYNVKDQRVVMGKRAGRACPAPTEWWKGERVLAGRGKSER